MIFIIYLIGVILSFILLYFVTDSSHTLEGMDELILLSIFSYFTIIIVTIVIIVQFKNKKKT